MIIKLKPAFDAIICHGLTVSRICFPNIDLRWDRVLDPQRADELIKIATCRRTAEWRTEKLTGKVYNVNVCTDEKIMPVTLHNPDRAWIELKRKNVMMNDPFWLPRLATRREHDSLLSNTLNPPKWIHQTAQLWHNPFTLNRKNSRWSDDTRRFSGTEHVNDPDDVLAADGALVHLFAAQGARHHVPTVQQHAVDPRVHADSAQLFVWKLRRLCGTLKHGATEYLIWKTAFYPLAFFCYSPQFLAHSIYPWEIYRC